MKALVRKLIEHVRSFSPATILIIGIAYLLALSALDFVAPPRIRFTRFYFLGIAFIAWGASKRSAIILAVLIAALSAAADSYSAATPPSFPMVFWNFTSRLAVLVTVGWLTAEATGLNRHLDKLAEERTAQWKAEADRHRATAGRLADALERFEQVANNITEVFWLADAASHRVVYVSPGYEKIWARPCQSMYQEPDSWLASVHPQDRAEVRKRMTDNLNAHEYEYRIFRPDGEMRWIRDRAFPVRNARNEVYRVAGIAEDITEQKRTEQRLVEAIDLNQKMLAASPMGIVAYKASGECVFCNDALARIIGGNVPAVLTGNFRRLEAWQSSGLLKLAENALTQDRAVSDEIHIRTRFGKVIWVDAHMAPFVSGGQPHLLHMTYDVTERKHAQDQILEISDREQARVGQDIHDGLCQQLVSLAFDANALQRKLAAQARPEALLAGRIASFLDQTITESRQLARGLFPIRLETEGLPSALEELSKAASERFNIECHFNGPQPTLALNKNTATHLYRIAQETLNNAIKHGRATVIVINLRSDANGLELAVEDNGCGIPPNALSQCSGMGLHIMSYRARSIGGILEFGPGPRGGTLVSCCVPRPSGYFASL
jgi:PAS domain S-box-containing protein